MAEALKALGRRQLSGEAGSLFERVPCRGPVVLKGADSDASLST